MVIRPILVPRSSDRRCDPGLPSRMTVVTWI